VTWITNTLPIEDWSSVTASADGNEFAVASWDNSVLFISTNSGATWNSNSVPISSGISYTDRVLGMACSADGATLVVNGQHEISFTDYIELLYVSTNSGATWFTNSNPANQTINISADGSAIIATGEGYICISTNYGLTWTNTNFNQPSLSSLSVACSANASTIVVGSRFDYYPGYITTNFGADWTSNSLLGNDITQIASSADGSKIEAVSAIADVVYTSTNFGVTWTTNNLPMSDWWGVASSADGNRLVVTAGNSGGNGPLSGAGPIYIGYAPPSPQLNIAASNGSLSFSWLVPSTNMVLQENSDLTTANWVTVTNSPKLNFSTLQYQLTFSPISSAGFYRLSTP